MASAEALIASAKTGLTNVRNSLNQYPDNWRNCTDAVRTCITYVDQSRIMSNPNRLEERIWVISEVQHFAYFDADNGCAQDAASWCEREWNRIISHDPYHVRALAGLGKAWLAKAQYWLARIHIEEGDADDINADKRCHTHNYVEARAVLMPAVDFLRRAVECARSERRLTGELLCLRAEASISLGNVSGSRAGRPRFKDAVYTLQSAVSIPGYRLPSHLSRYLRDHEYILR